MRFLGEDFEQLRTSLYDIDSSIDEIAQESAKEIESLVQEQFASGVDPYGSSWQPNVYGTQTLVKTGAMLASLVVMVDGKEIFMSMDEPANYHQSGTSRLPIRKIFPDEGELPDKWNAVLEKNTDNILSEKIGGK